MVLHSKKNAINIAQTLKMYINKWKYISLDSQFIWSLQCVRWKQNIESIYCRIMMHALHIIYCTTKSHADQFNSNPCSKIETQFSYKLYFMNNFMLFVNINGNNQWIWIEMVENNLLSNGRNQICVLCIAYWIQEKFYVNYYGIYL